MAEREVPKDIRRFIAGNIDSIGQLEALLLLRAESRPWEAVEVARRLYTGEGETIAMLEGLCRAGLLVCTGGVYTYECSSEELRRMVNDLAEVYSRQLIPVTNLIHAKSRHIRAFADAFRFRKDS